MFVFVVAILVTGGEGLVIDLTHSVGPNSMTWPGERPYTRTETYRGYVVPGDFWRESYDFCMAEHTGTHIDAPSHFAENKWTVEQIPLDHLIAPGVVVDIQEKVAQNPAVQVTTDDIMTWLDIHGPLPDRVIMLFRTGWAKRYGNTKEYFGSTNDTSKFKFPSISVEAAQLLTGYERATGRRVVGVGLDTPSVDRGTSTRFPTHVELSTNNIFGLENVADMQKLPATGFQLTVMPMKLVGGSGSPIRIIATIPEDTTSNAPRVFVTAPFLALLLASLFQL